MWTTGSWILHGALHQPAADRAAAVDAAVRQGALAWHALPVTTHTELMDADLVRAGLGIAAELDARFGRIDPATRTVAAKMTDVPGHSRSLVPLLAEAGVTFLHLGVNPAWPVPDVPPVFRWRSPYGAEVVVAYQAGGYGAPMPVPGMRRGASPSCTPATTWAAAVDDVVATGPLRPAGTFPQRRRAGLHPRRLRPGSGLQRGGETCPWSRPRSVTRGSTVPAATRPDQTGSA